MEYAKLNVYPHTHGKVVKLAKKHSLTMAEFMDASCDYFMKSGINPQEDGVKIDVKFQDLERKLLKRNDQVIAFIKTQEQEWLTPILMKQDAILDKLGLTKSSNIEVFSPSKSNAGESKTVTKSNEALQDELLKSQEESERLRAHLSKIVRNIERKVGGLHSQVKYEIKTTGDFTESFYNTLIKEYSR